MHEIKAIIRPERLERVLDALHEITSMPGITVSEVIGYGRREPPARSGGIEYGRVPMTKLEVVVGDSLVAQAVATIRHAASTGHPGDGKVFVSVIDQAMSIRSADEGVEAL